MDIVYALGSGSNWDNNELRYSLRSVDKYVNHVGNVYLIGEKPKWIKNIIHIPMNDRPGVEWKEFNIMQKILRACATPALSREFIFMNDDHFLLHVIPPLPFYYQQTLLSSMFKRRVQDTYHKALDNTYQALMRRDYNVINYDIHVPIIYDKNLFADTVLSYDWNTAPGGYVIKSLYCNTLGVKGQEVMDLKIKERMDCFKLEALTLGRKFFSIDDSSINLDMGTYLQYLYPIKSKYEL